MEQPEAYLGRLKPIYIFKGLKDPDLLQVAEELEIIHYATGDLVFEERDEGQYFYIINKGRVQVLRKGSRPQAELVASLVPGDFFGEGALLYGRRRSATIKAETDVELLRLSKEDFDKLVLRYPQIKPNLLVSYESHELYWRHHFNWLTPNEVVYLVARRHKFVLYQALALPLVIGVLIALAAMWLAVYYEALWIAWVGAALEVPVALWMVWNKIDWSNDYYIVTNERIVYLEKIVAIYDSRLEAPLSSVMSVNVQTDSEIERVLGMGDVIVRTFSGPIVLKSVAHPQGLAAVIEEHWQRTKTRERESQLEQMKRSIRDRIDGTKPPPKRPGAAKPEKKPPAALHERIIEFFTGSLRLRYEEGSNVIYRKHWFMLWLRVWKPTLSLLGVVVVLTLAAAGMLPGGLPLSAVLLVALVAFIPLAGWWVYEYADWKNDIYMVTPDQIFDISRKPLGAEARKSAPLSNVLSLRYERPGLLGLLMNYGTVVAQVAGTEFRFEGVFDPVSVQNDVYRRIEANNNKKGQAEAMKRRDEIADWLTVYHTVFSELEADEQQPPRKRPPPIPPKPPPTDPRRDKP